VFLYDFVGSMFKIVNFKELGTARGSVVDAVRPMVRNGSYRGPVTGSRERRLTGGPVLGLVRCA